MLFFKPEDTRSERIVAIAGLTVFVLASLWSIRYYPASFTNDLISYLQLARLVADGHWLESLNAYWSPLFSWLMVPFLWLQIDWFDAFRLVNILAGIAVLLLSFRMLKLLHVSSWGLYSCYALLVFFCFAYQLDMPFADFLAAPVLLLYILVLNSSISHSRSWWKPGMVGILCFFAKGFYLAFIPGFFTLVCIFIWYKRTFPRWDVFRFYASNMVVFAIVLMLWSSLLSFKYGKFTLTSSAGFNSDIPLKNPETELLKPHCELNVSEWDDPTYRNIKVRNPFGSKEEIQFQLNVWKYNSQILYYMFHYFSYLGVAVLLLLLIPLVKKEFNSLYVLSALCAVLYMGLYTLLFLFERYTIPAHVLFIILAFKAIESSFQFLPAKFKGASAILTIFVFISFVKNPIYYLKTWMELDKNLIDYTWKMTIDMARREPWMQYKRTVSTGANLGVVACMYSNSQEYGQIKVLANMQQEIEEVKRHNIQLLFYTRSLSIPDENRRVLDEYLEDKKCLFRDERTSLEIYELSQ